MMAESAVPGSKPASTFQRLFADGRAPLIWGVIWGVIQAAVPLGFWWLDAATVYALSIVLIAAVYIGFAVADGRPTVIAVEVGGVKQRSGRCAAQADGKSSRAGRLRRPSSGVGAASARSATRVRILSSSRSS